MLQTQPFFRLFPLLVLLFALRPSIAEEPPCHSEPWEKDIAKFEAEDRTNPPPHESILFVGSSSIRGWRLPKYFPELTTINRGFGGSQICDSTHFLDRLVLKHRPQVVVIYAGDNDVAAGKSAEQVHRDFLAFVVGVHATLPETKSYSSLSNRALRVGNLPTQCTRPIRSLLRNVRNKKNWRLSISGNRCSATTTARGRSCSKKMGCTCRTKDILCGPSC